MAGNVLASNQTPATVVFLPHRKLPAANASPLMTWRLSRGSVKSWNANSEIGVPGVWPAGLRGWDGNAIGRNDLGLVGEDFAAGGIDEDLEPVYVVGAVGLVVAEGFDAGEIFEALAFRVLEGLVDAEIVRVAVDEGDRLLEADDLVAQSEQERLEPVGLAIGFGESFGVTKRSTSTVAEIETGIGLGDEHDGGGVAGASFLEGFLHPQNVGLVASCEFSRIGSRVAKIVAGALNVDGGVSDATEGPAAIFDARHHAAYAQTKGSGLNLLMEPMLAERERRAEEEGTLVVEALE